MNNSNKKVSDNLFKAGLIVKGVNGVLEIIGGILLLFINQTSIGGFVKLIFHHELLQDPNDFVGNFLLNLSSNLSVGIQYFFAIYFLINGVVKIGLIYGLWRKKLWTYVVAEIIFSVLLIYEVYKFASNHSIYLLFLIFLDVIVVILIWLKYKELKRMKRYNLKEVK